MNTSEELPPGSVVCCIWCVLIIIILVPPTVLFFVLKVSFFENRSSPRNTTQHYEVQHKVTSYIIGASFFLSIVAYIGWCGFYCIFVVLENEKPAINSHHNESEIENLPSKIITVSPSQSVYVVETKISA